MWSQSDYNERVRAVAMNGEDSLRTVRVSGTKTILIAHRQSEIRDRFAAALADARHGYVTADSSGAAHRAIADHTRPISLALIDLGLADDGVGLIAELRRQAGRTLPFVIFAATVASADQVRELLALHVGGYVNEHAPTAQILSALAPHLFPDNFNRRASPRVTLGIPVSYRAGQTIAAALTLNIGKGGLAIRTMNPIAPDTSVHLKFRLPGRNADIEADGRVAWSDSRSGMGIQFERLDEDAQAAIEAFVDRGGS
jgi:uncharacterized protein (TIGR02266 family)